jgi:hypothetical protein
MPLWIRQEVFDHGYHVRDHSSPDESKLTFGSLSMLLQELSVREDRERCGVR